MKYLFRASCLWGASFILAAAPGWAQSTAPAPARPAATTEPARDEEVVKLEAFTVTGSNIRRIEEERVLPVTLYDRDDIELRGGATPVELFEFLPMAGELPISEEGTLGASARGDVASISLRSIGSSNTLTLVNGRRFPAHPVSQAESGVPSLAVNINALPGAAIQRFEVLRDGASAIYGADAAAGVVNAILDRDADGTRLLFRGSFTERGGAAERRVTASDGRIVNSGRTTVRVTADYFHRDILMAKDRDFAADSDMRRFLPAPWNGVPVETALGTLRDNDFDNSSSTSNYGTFIRGSFQTVNGELQFIGSRPENATNSTTVFRGITTSTTPGLILTARANTTAQPGEFYLTPLAAGGTGFRQTLPSRNVEGAEADWFYNLNQDRHILPETDRYTFVATVDHELNDRLALFSDLTVYFADSTLYRDPAGLDSTDDPNIFVPASNPWNPFGTRFYHPTGAPNPDGTLRVQGTPADVLVGPGTGVRPREFRAKEAEVQSYAARLVVGLRGKFSQQWEWESALLYGYARTSDLERWNIRESRLREALARTDETAFNPFGYTFRVIPNPGGVTGAGTATQNPRLVQIDQPYTNPDSVVSPLYDDFLRVAHTKLLTWDAKANGPLFSVRGRTVRAALGTELRREGYEDWRPPYAGMNPAGSSATNPYLRENDNDFIGLSPNLDLTSSRDVVAGFTELLVPLVAPRHRVPLVRGLEFTAAVRYEHFSDFGDTLKPKYGVNWAITNWLGARASYNESFRAPNLVQTNVSPLQRSVTGITDWYRSPVTNAAVDGSRTRTVFRVGNGTLQPEEAENFTFGIVVEVPGIKGLSFTADYWKLKQTDVITNLTATGQIRRDEAILDAFTRAAVAAGQNPNLLNTGSGTPAYIGNPKVRRAPVTPGDQAVFEAYNNNPANASSPRAPVGVIVSVVDDYLNLARRDLNGVDMAIQYRVPRTRFGTFTIRGEASWMGKFLQQDEANDIMQDNLGEDGLTKWKANGSIVWRRGKWGAGWLTSFVKGSVDTSSFVGASTTDPDLVEAVVEALGRPSYIRPFSTSTGIMRYGYLVEDWIVHNAYFQYRFGRQKDIHNNVTLRLGINNVLDTDPPIADESRGYRTGGSNPRGRQYYLQITKLL